MKEFKILQWDSDFFNYKVCLIESGIIHSVHDLKRILLELKEDNVKLAYLFIENDNKERNEIALSGGGNLVDQKTIFRSENISDSLPSQDIVSYRNSEADETLIDLAIQSGLYSRFSKDSNFVNKEFERMYSEWIKKSVRREIADEVLVYKLNDEIIGLVTLSKKGETGQIGLIAVNSNYRGKGIGTKLMSAAHHWYITNNCKVAEVVTQYANKEACALYSKFGYQIKEILNIYHFWPLNKTI